MDELVQIVQQLVPQLGEADSEPAPLERRDNEPQLPRQPRRHRVRDPRAGQGHQPARDRPRRRGEANQPAAELGIAPSVAAVLEDPPCLVTTFIEGSEMSSERAARAGGAGAGGGELAAPPRLGAARCRRSSTRSASSRRYADTATERGAELPAAYDEALAHAREIEAALAGPEHDPVPCHDDLLAANFLRDGRADLDRRLGVRRDGRPLLRPRQLRGQQRARRRRRGLRCSRPTSGSRRMAGAGRRCG